MQGLKIRGKVIIGEQKGRILDFPTANVETEEKIKSGVYAGEAIVKGKKYQAAIFVPENKTYIEAHILGFSSDIYGKIITVIIGEKIREVLKFKNDEELKKQITKDIEKICQLTNDK